MLWNGASDVENQERDCDPETPSATSRRVEIGISRGSAELENLPSLVEAELANPEEKILLAATEVTDDKKANHRHANKPLIVTFATLLTVSIVTVAVLVAKFVVNSGSDNYNLSLTETESPHKTLPTFTGVTWIQRGAPIRGENETYGEESGLALSTDGSVLALGSAQSFDGLGHVRVVDWDDARGIWIQRGSHINGEEVGGATEMTGSVLLSSNGRILVTSSMCHVMGAAVMTYPHLYYDNQQGLTGGRCGVGWAWYFSYEMDTSWPCLVFVYSW